jgi:membrane protein implicated in regulation of membrane protease activity
MVSGGRRSGMSRYVDGAFSAMSLGIVAAVALLVIALALFASPLIAVIIFLILAVVLLLGMWALRQRSRAAEQTDVSEPGFGPAGQREQGSRDPRVTGAPVSGEGS